MKVRQVVQTANPAELLLHEYGVFHVIPPGKGEADRLVLVSEPGRSITEMQAAENAGLWTLRKIAEFVPQQGVVPGIAS